MATTNRKDLYLKDAGTGTGGVTPPTTVKPPVTDTNTAGTGAGTIDIDKALQEIYSQYGITPYTAGAIPQNAQYTANQYTGTMNLNPVSNNYVASMFDDDYIAQMIDKYYTPNQFAESDRLQGMRNQLDGMGFNTSEATNNAWNDYLTAKGQEIADNRGQSFDYLQGIVDKINNRGEFSYDMNADALYQQYKNQYMNLGNLAMQDTIGQASAMTGGYGNSYASTAGNQAYQSYLTQLNDKMPELYQMALDRYNAEGDRLAQSYQMAMNNYNIANETYLNDLNQKNINVQNAFSVYSQMYNQDRQSFEFDYNALMNRIAQLSNEERSDFQTQELNQLNSIKSQMEMIMANNGERLNEYNANLNKFNINEGNRQTQAKMDMDAIMANNDNIYKTATFDRDTFLANEDNRYREASSALDIYSQGERNRLNEINSQNEATLQAKEDALNKLYAQYEMSNGGSSSQAKSDVQQAFKQLGFSDAGKMYDYLGNMLSTKGENAVFDFLSAQLGGTEEGDKMVDAIYSSLFQSNGTSSVVPARPEYLNDIGATYTPSAVDVNKASVVNSPDMALGYPSNTPLKATDLALKKFMIFK